MEAICERVKKMVTPTPSQEARVLRLAEDLKKKVEEAAAKKGLSALARLDGSVAKRTWLKDEADLDIFMLIPPEMPKEEMRRRCLEVAKEAVKGHRVIERYAEHPYVEAIVKGVRVNLVPAYRVEKGQWLSATDRTPYHTEYINSHLDDRRRGEVRLLKAFMKGVGVYGSEIKVGGFSGMLCETLIVNYGSFGSTLKEASGWGYSEIVDVEGHYRGRMDEARDLFHEPLVVVDPVDPARNLAASVTLTRLLEFIEASRLFIRKPSIRFFFPRKITPPPVGAFRRLLRGRGTNLITLTFGRVDAVVDVLWSQLYKTERSLVNHMRQMGFHVIRSSSWSDEAEGNAIVIELEASQLPSVKRHQGPPIFREADSSKFLFKHLRARDTVSGPWIEGDRWVVAKRRGVTLASKVLASILSVDGGRPFGVAEKVAASIRKGYAILEDDEVLKLYRSSKEFALFLARFVDGRPSWLVA